MAAGTLAKWARQGCEVSYVLCTSGDKGSSDPEVVPAELAATREREQRAAAAVVGARDVAFLRYPDGALQNTLELRRDLVREIRRFRPDVLLCQDPTNRFSNGYVNHPDHRAAGDTALDAVYPSARDYHAYPDLIEEGLMPHKTLEVYLGGTADSSTVWVDISDTIDLKVAALREHASQVGTDPGAAGDPGVADQGAGRRAGRSSRARLRRGLPVHSPALSGRTQISLPPVPG